MRHAVMFVLVLLALGCQPKPGFSDEIEEYRYLNGLADPTPAQSERKRAIADRPPPLHLRSKTVRQAAEAADAFDRNR